MKKVLVAYFSLSGNTEKMAELVGEGVRFAGHQAILKKVSDIKNAEDLVGYDGYIFGAPTHFRDVPGPMKTFLFLAKKAPLKGKLAGAFGSFLHDGSAPAIIFETMQYVFDMEPFELGTFNLKEYDLGIFDTRETALESRTGFRACQQYGKAFGEKLEADAARKDSA